MITTGVRGLNWKVDFIHRLQQSSPLAQFLNKIRTFLSSSGTTHLRFLSFIFHFSSVVKLGVCALVHHSATT